MCRIRLRRKARGYSRHPVEKIGQVQGNLKQENSIETQRRVLNDGKWQKDEVLDVSTRRLVAIEEDQEHLNFPEDSIITRKLVASGNSETEGKNQNLATQSPHINRLRAAPGEGFLDFETKIWSQSERSNEKTSM